VVSTNRMPSLFMIVGVGVLRRWSDGVIRLPRF
jgi:hypothetical protein